ncbi:hypothetical protein AB3S75_008894 [Citrus x aurantiifolia]
MTSTSFALSSATSSLINRRPLTNAFVSVFMTSTSFALSSATSSLINRRPLTNAFVSVSSFSAANCIIDNVNANKRRISCEVAVKSNNSTASVGLESSPSSSASASDDGFDESKIGSRVKVKVPLKVYHVPRVPEHDLSGMEGVLKQYVGVWKGKKISANMPYKVAFVTEIEGRPVKFFAHLKEDEFDYLD